MPLEDPPAAGPLARRTARLALLACVIGARAHAAVEVLAGQVPARIERTIERDALLCVWLDAPGCAAELRVERAGATVANDRSGPAPSMSPCLSLAVQRGEQLTFVVAGSATGCDAFELHVFESVENEEARALADAAIAELAPLLELRGPERAKAREPAARFAAELLGTEGHENSDLLARATALAGLVSLHAGDAASAVTALRAAAEFQARVWSPDHPRRVATLGRLCDAAEAAGDVPLRRRCAEEILATLAATLGEDDTRLAIARSEVASVLLYTGEFRRARALQERALACFLRQPQADPRMLLAVRGNLALICKALGDNRRAAALERELLVQLEADPASDPLDLARARHNLATTLLDSSEFAEARELEEEVLASLAAKLPDDHLDLQRPRATLAQILRRQGDFAASRALIERVLEVRSKVLPPGHPDLVRSQLESAILCRCLGEHERGRDLLIAATSAAEQAGGDAEAVLLLRHELAFALYWCGDAAGARALSASNLEVVQHTMQIAGWSAAPREIEAQADAMREYISAALSLAEPVDELPAAPELERSAFEVLETLRSIALTSARALAHERRDPQSTELRARLIEASGAVSNGVRRGARATEMHMLTEARDAAWRALMERAAAPRLDRDPTPAELARQLDDATALVVYGAYSRLELDRKGEGFDGRTTARLAAFVVRATGDFARVELGLLARIDELAARWRSLLEDGASPAASIRDAGLALRAAILDPLQTAIGEAQHVVFVCEGSLRAIPLDALPDPGTDKGLLGERVRVEVRNTARELLWPPPERAPAEALVVLGGIDYGAQAGKSPRFAQLPGTEPEARGIADLFGRCFERAELRVLVGAAATREALIGAAPTARWLHVATHGWSDELLEPRAQASLGFASTGAQQEAVPVPLAHCGIALADANVADDGALTAEELAALDLSACELVVLSACDTGKGVATTGQGIASLHAAASIGGARHVLTSAWKVSDEATRELMLEFYRQLWTEKENPARALWKAKLAMRSKRQAPRDWAGWLVVGPAE